MIPEDQKIWLHNEVVQGDFYSRHTGTQEA